MHRGFPKLHFERQIPCNCATCSGSNTPHFYDLAQLRERLANGKPTIECRYKPYIDAPIRGMVDEVDPWFGERRGRGDTFINTGGGAYTGGDADIGGDFMGRDQRGD